MTDELDAKDRKLLAALRRNSRASLVSLAREIDLSRSATHDRITRLEEIGAITGYTIHVGTGFDPASDAFISLRFENGRTEPDITGRVAAIAGVDAAYCVSGDIDMLVRCRCETPSDLGRLRDELAALDGVTIAQTRLILARTIA